MGLEFGKGFEALFRQELKNGISLFCGAGFSVEARDDNERLLPCGMGLLNEMKTEFPAVSSYTNLPRACTKLIRADRQSFYNYLVRRLTVRSYSPLYRNILKVNIRNIYTTNIDDLLPLIYEEHGTESFLIDRSKSGENPADQFGVNYFPLHGCVRRPDDGFVFGAMEIASAFSQKDKNKAWQNLAEDAQKHSILFWGWNFEDPGPLEAMYGAGGQKVDENIKKWVLLRNPSTETVDYLESLKFNIIIGDTRQMLEYLDGLDIETANEATEFDEKSKEYFSQYLPPRNDMHLSSYPLKTFFLDYTPRWSHIYLNEIPKTRHYRSIANYIAEGKNVVVYGIRGSGKTTLMMQLMADLECSREKHFIVAPTENQIRLYMKKLDGRRSLLMVDDCFRDTNAVIEILKAQNVQSVLFDRDFNFERQFHKINGYSFVTEDITEISQGDAQSILNVIPQEIKRKNASTKKFLQDPTLLNLLATSVRAVNFNFVNDFYGKDKEAAEVFLMISYVYACGVPCSFDMVYSYLGDEEYTWEQMFAVLERIGGLIKEWSDYLSDFDLIAKDKAKDKDQDYYQCRSRIFAEKILESLPRGDNLLAKVLMKFVQDVPPYKICQYDRFKRGGYDADYAEKAFPNCEDGQRYYNECIGRDESEYIYQQAAIYFWRMGQKKEAFAWIEKARNMAHYNRFSIDSTYAQFFFDANIQSDRALAEKALSILDGCCLNDKRKAIHFAAFAKRVLEFAQGSSDEKSDGYIQKALDYIDEGLTSDKVALSQKTKWELIEYRKKLKEIGD